MSTTIVIQLIVGVFFVITGLIRLGDERMRHGVGSVACGFACVFAGIVSWGMDVRGEKVEALESRISVLEAQLAKQAPATENASAAEKK